VISANTTDNWIRRCGSGESIAGVRRNCNRSADIVRTAGSTLRRWTSRRSGTRARRGGGEVRSCRSDTLPPAASVLHAPPTTVGQPTAAKSDSSSSSAG
jgi:hypothetical protein